MTNVSEVLVSLKLFGGIIVRITLFFEFLSQNSIQFLLFHQYKDSKTARTLRHHTESCRRLALYVQLGAQHRAIFEGEVQDTIGLHRDLLHHSIPQRGHEFGVLLIAVNQLFYKGCEHFAP